jgi:hypothetical protein
MLLSSNPLGQVGKYGTWGKVRGERYCGEMIVDWLAMKGQKKTKKIKGVARKGARRRYSVESLD